tara:strand:- start:410 stop:514 length:105 start_codon:yes stop_codon:yes gene_type:complete
MNKNIKDYILKKLREDKIDLRFLLYECSIILQLE